MSKNLVNALRSEANYWKEAYGRQSVELTRLTKQSQIDIERISELQELTNHNYRTITNMIITNRTLTDNYDDVCEDFDVVENRLMESDEENVELRKRLFAAEKLIEEYQSTIDFIVDNSIELIEEKDATIKKLTEDKYR